MEDNQQGQPQKPPQEPPIKEATPTPNETKPIFHGREGLKNVSTEGTDNSTDKE